MLRKIIRQNTYLIINTETYNSGEDNLYYMFKRGFQSKTHEI